MRRRLHGVRFNRSIERRYTRDTGVAILIMGLSVFSLPFISVGLAGLVRISQYILGV